MQKGEPTLGNVLVNIFYLWGMTFPYFLRTFDVSYMYLLINLLM